MFFYYIYFGDNRPAGDGYIADTVLTLSVPNTSEMRQFVQIEMFTVLNIPVLTIFRLNGRRHSPRSDYDVLVSKQPFSNGQRNDYGFPISTLYSYEHYVLAVKRVTFNSHMTLYEWALKVPGVSIGYFWILFLRQHVVV